VAVSAPWRRSKKAEIDTRHGLVKPMLRGGSLCATDFDKSEWEIMYPLFVEEGLVDPSECVNRKDV
jgi:hypothetical protein